MPASARSILTPRCPRRVLSPCLPARIWPRDGIGTVPCVSAVTNRDGSEMTLPPRPALASDRVRHVGDAVALVVAETAAQARDAADLIEVDYEPRSAAVETGKALDPGQPLVWDDHPGNLCFDWEIGDRAAAERGMAAARHRVSLTLVNNRVVANSMEPRGAIGEYDPGEDSYTLWSSTQGSHFLRNLLAEHVFHIPENRIRVVTPDVGGGFGMKLFLYPEHVLVLWAAKKSAGRSNGSPTARKRLSPTRRGATMSQSSIWRSTTAVASSLCRSS